MADQTTPPAQGQQGKKILGMPRTTGLIVIGVGALVIGYLVISHFSGSKPTGSSGSGGGGGGGHGSGQAHTVRVIRQWQGHQPRRR